MSKAKSRLEAKCEKYARKVAVLSKQLTDRDKLIRALRDENAKLQRQIRALVARG